MSSPAASPPPSIGVGADHASPPAPQAVVTPTARRTRTMRDRAGSRTAPRAVWALTLLNLALLLAYSLVFPPFRAPDEAEHVDMVLHLRREGTWPPLERAFLSRPVARARQLTGAVEFDRRGARAAGEAPGRQPGFDDLGPSRPTGERNLIAAHPPGYYALLGATSAGVEAVLGGAGWSFPRQVWVMRLLSLLLVAPLPLLAWAAARHIGARPPVAVGAAALPLAIPQLTHIGAAVSNDTLLSVLVGLLTVLLARAWDGDLTDRLAIAAGLTGAAALLTKGFALLLPPWIAAAYLLAWLRHRDGRALRAGLLATGVATVAGGWWWARNLVLFGQVQPTVATVPLAPPSFRPRVADWLPRFTGRMLRRYWGEFAYFDTVLPPLAVTVPSFVTGVGVVAGFLDRRRDRRHRWLEVGLLLYPTVAILGLVAYGSWRAYVRTGLTPGIHGRYLFPGVVGLAVVVALGLGWVMGRWARWLPLVAVGGVAAMQAAALTRILPTYWTSAAAVVAWAPLPAAAVWAVAALVAGAGLWALAEVLRVGRGG